MLDPEQLAGMIESRDADLASVIDALPPTGLPAVTRDLALSWNLQSRLTGLNMIAEALARGSGPAEGGWLAAATLQVSMAHLDDPGLAPTLIATIAAQAASALAGAYGHDGRHAEIVALSNDMESRLEGRTDGVRLTSLRIAAAEALKALGPPDKAMALLDDLKAADRNYPTEPLVRRDLEARLESVTALPDPRSPAQRSVDEHNETMAVAAEWIASMLSDDPDLAPLGAGLAKDAREQANTPARVRGTFDLIIASTWYVDDGDNDPAVLGAALTEYRDAIDRHDANGQREAGHHARWGAARAERKLGRPGAALDLLEELAGRLEVDRAMIADPLRRASTPFPRLPAARVECADTIGDPRRMLAAIEAAKGRALAELLNAGELPPHATSKEVEELVARLGIGYVSYFAAADALFAVAVWPDGGWHSARIPLEVAARRDLARQPKPVFENPAARTRFDLGVELAPLVDWLLPLLPTLPDGGHLVFSPDEELHLWPLHLAATPAGPLGLQVGVSRVHGIDMLRRIAAREPHRPARSIAAHIPDAREGELAAKTAAMAATLATLPDPVLLIPTEAADEERFAGLQASEALIYLNGHGVFPEYSILDGIDPNPFLSAGLMLAHDGRWPDRSGEWLHRLTPALVLKSEGLDVEGATVLLQGCVSGLAKEGRGGDALGLEWAFLARGAETVLASHWHVDYRTAGPFCRRFCETWLLEGKSRIDAWRDAVAATHQDPEGGPEYDWAGFTLTGDWR